MKISTILDHIDSGHMALPEFQRGYVWGPHQVRGLFASLYQRHPIGGLLVWATEAKSAAHRGDQDLASGVVKLLLDGQQRMTSLYGVMRGRPPAFFDGNEGAFTGLRFHLEDEVFEFYQPVKMRDDPLWVDVTDLMKGGQASLGQAVKVLSQDEALSERLSDYIGRLSKLLGIADIDLHIEEVTGADMTLDVVVDIFNKVNSGGTKLSKGDLALAKICAEWPEARGKMKSQLSEWSDQGYDFNLDWLLRSVNTVLTGEAKFTFLHDQSPDAVQSGLDRATRQIDNVLNLIAGRLGLDHARVLFGRFAIPIMVRYLDQKGGKLDERERDKLLFWFAQAGMWGLYSSSTESRLDRDLAVLEAGGLDGLLEELRLWQGGMRMEAGHFTGWSMGNRFYPVLYMMTRMGEARDWGSGIALKSNLLGKMSRLEVHHIFPKSRLYAHNLSRPEVNALANFCFLTKDTNLNISNRLPEDYFPEVEDKHPGALASQWVPMDPDLWRIERYGDFLEARKALLAEEANKRFADLLHGDDRWLMETRPAGHTDQVETLGGISSEEEEAELESVNDWLIERGLPKGFISHEITDEAGTVIAQLDLAWPDGLQQGLSTPVALLLNEDDQLIVLASQAGFRCFKSSAALREYVLREITNDTTAA
ncbi:DUF262 domain-containing protein [Oceanicaulis sp. MMSF_3324]|uniref:GmrSD restriction endonuclease domain-containing protein n=1 Tax=Oceanicaulis sp. MMSF_3324 TaxID=3046702 RepID=UPI00273EDB57|nr:DUF262 domain-containing protein [Oceanicaulis sp. MMSF_3324]